MATKRCRGDSWQYTIKRAGLLPQPVEQQVVVIEQTATLERHYTDAD